MKSEAIMEIAPDTHSQFSQNLVDFSTCVPPALQWPIWLQISFQFWLFWVPFISPKHNQAVEFFGLFFSLWATLPKLGALHIFPPEIWILEFIYLAWKRTLLLIECVRQNAFWNQFGTVLVHSKLCLDASALKFWAYGTFHRMWRWIMPHEPPWPPTLEFACDFLPS